MTSPKRKYLMSASQKRQSFDERICDDLCHLILQYLPLKYKLRLECVSKQFQRNIYLSERQWFVENINKNGWLRQLRLVLKKCNNLNKFTFDQADYHNRPHNSYEFKISDLVNSRSVMPLYNIGIDMILHGCHNLTHFNFYCHHISKNNLDQLLEKFGSRFVYLDFTKCNPNNLPPEESDIMSNKIKTSKVETIIIDSIDSKFSDINFNNLKALKVKRLKYEDLDHLRVFINKNGQSISNIKIICGYMTNAITASYIFNMVVKLPSLVRLSLNVNDFECDSDLIERRFKQISLNCQQLECIELLISKDLANHFLSSLKHLKSLKRLNLQYFNRQYFNNHSQRERDRASLARSLKLFTFECLRGCPLLESVSLALPDITQPIADTIFIDIDIYLPKLKSLTISGVSIDISKWTAHALSRLSDLKTIEMKLSKNAFKFVRDYTKSKITNNCKRLQNMRIYFYDNFDNIVSDDSSDSDYSPGGGQHH